ncbi:hypothetical protein KEM54_002465 [Ascosphaera aggregata]|nr:hypothetical protein KEM54_002465 [Ascosphaera aggregata]
MSSAAVFERRNKQVQDALDSGNLKQALQLCEKRIKKGENSYYLLAWKANILCAHNDAASKQRGIKETLDICRAEPPVTDLDTIELLCENLKLDDEYKTTVQSLWERAAKANPQILEIQLRWFSNAVEVGDWKAAQKSSEADSKLFGTLAYRMIAKAASMVPSDPENLAPQPRAIQNSEELLLLVRIFETQGRFVETAETLNSKTLGTDSQVAQGDWIFTQERLRSLEKAKLWEELLRTAKQLLTLPEGDSDSISFNSEERDDWEVWQGLLRSTREQLTQTFKDSIDFVTSYISKRPKSRNSRLCLLNLVEIGVQNGELQSADLIQHCQRYLDENGHKLYCFPDLREVLGKLSSDDRKAVLDYVFTISPKESSQ